MEEQLPKLVLMFDVNKTLVMQDNATKKSLSIIVRKINSLGRLSLKRHGELKKTRKSTASLSINGNKVLLFKSLR